MVFKPKLIFGRQSLHTGCDSDTVAPLLQYDCSKGVTVSLSHPVHFANSLPPHVMSTWFINGPYFNQAFDELLKHYIFNRVIHTTGVYCLIHDIAQKIDFNVVMHLVNVCQRPTIFPKNIPKIKVKANRKARLDAIKTNDFDRNPKRNAHIKEEQHMTSEKPREIVN